MPATNLIKLTIGGPETVPGEAEAMQFVIPIRAVSDLNMKVEKTVDPAIIASNMGSDTYPTVLDPGGGIPLAPRPCGAMGKLLRSVLGYPGLEDEVAPVQIAACIRLRYTGTEASQVFVANNTANTVTSKIGARGAEVVDDDFGTPGYQELGLSGVTPAGNSGLTASHEYKVKVAIDGAGAVELTITTGTGTVTWANLLALLQAENATITWSIVGGDVRCMSHTVGDDSDIAITAGTSDDLLTALSSTPDAAVSGVSGILDFDDDRYDALAEIVALAGALTNYDCEKVFGSDSLDIKTSKVETFATREGKNTWCYVWFLSADSGVYRHTFMYDTGQDEHPTYSIQKDGYMDNFLYAGNVVDSLSLSAALKGMVEGDVTIIGFTEEDGQEESELTLDDVNPLIFSEGSFAIGAVTFTFIRNISISFEAGHNKDGYGQGAITRQYHQKGAYKASGKATIRMDADSYALRAQIFTSNRVAVSFWFNGKDIVTDIPELMLVELPYCTYENFEYKENSGVFDADFSYNVVNPKGTLYNNPIMVHLLTADEDQY